MEAGTVKKEEPAAFMSPWEDSNIILVVDDIELHVHRCILCMQSPVFKTMFNGSFKEAEEQKIPLKGKDPDEMIEFLKLLYPSNMFDNPLCEENLITILAYADEYQAENVIKQVFEETNITRDNALEILPYACKYNAEARVVCLRYARREIKCQNLKETLPNLEHKVREEVLMAKCELLEDVLLKARKCLVACMSMICDKDEAKCCFSHKVKLHDRPKMDGCNACRLAYETNFCDYVVARSKNTAFGENRNKESNPLSDLLCDMDELLCQTPNMTNSMF